ncbi:MAG TPA: GDYXXLXY domain-containing protein [Gammaproteobacteria bacterium]
MLNLEKATNTILFAVLAVILILANYLIFNKERVLANGTVMLLDLAPRDPRSILQGDYMVLRYSMAADIARRSKELTADGQVVVRLDDKHVAQFQRIHDGNKPLGNNEYLLLYRKRNGVVKIATDAFFFQEQHGKYYSSARYGEVRVSSKGDAVLSGVRDGQLNKLTAVASQG